MGVKIREKIKGSGVYWVFVAQDGRRRSLKAGSYDVAEEVAKRLTIKLSDDPDSVFKQREKPKPQFKKLSEEWLAKIKKKAKDTTYNRYHQLLQDRVLPMVGSKRVDEIRKSHIADVIDKAHDEKLSVSTLGLIRTCFSGPLEIAAFRELIPANPTNGILKQLGYSRTKERNNGSAKVKFLTPEQVNSFMSISEEGWPDYHPFYEFLFMTGTRLGEALAVTWSDINWKEKTVSINKAFRIELGSTKTGAEREIDLPDVLISSLKSLQLERKKEALKTGTKVPEIIFHNKERHMRQNQARRVFKRILEKAELPDHRLHDTRHSYASLMLKNGASLDYVKRMLGHADIAMTSNIYGHLMPNRDRTQVNLLGATILNPAAPICTQESEKAINH